MDLKNTAGLAVLQNKVSFLKSNWFALLTSFEVCRAIECRVSSSVKRRFAHDR